MTAADSTSSLASDREQTLLHQPSDEPAGLTPFNSSGCPSVHVLTTTISPEMSTQRARGASQKRIAAGIVLSSFFLPTVSADCISLSNSSSCPAFADSQVSTSDALVDKYSFLEFVANTAQFDAKFEDWINSDYAKNKYETSFGCSDLTLSNTTDLYARYTTTVLCSSMVQDSKEDCSLSDDQTTPICADTCALFAQSEQIIVVNEETCGNSSETALNQIRSDFTVCSLPTKSLDKSCIKGSDNEDDNCGYKDNLPGLCLYCSDTSPNSTDTCCYGAQTETRCVGVELPTITDLPPISTTTTISPSNTNSSSNDEDDGGHGLSGGAIAGIAIGALAGVALIAFGLLFCWRRRRQEGYASGVSVFNQPSRQHGNPIMAYNPKGMVSKERGYEAIPGARVARMSALEDASVRGVPASPMVGAAAATRRGGDSSSSELGLEDSPGKSSRRARHPQPRDRHASLSSASVLADSPTSRTSSGEKDPVTGDYVGSGEQLPAFKDYYSSDNIKINDKVSTLWAYSPRAEDEFELVRGDMLKIIGIWDDGWATGIRIPERAEDFARRKEMRDSGISASGTSSHRASSPTHAATDVKAFPLVCVCLPEHWQRAVDAEAGMMDTADEVPHGDAADDHDINPKASGHIMLGKSSSRFKDDLKS